MSQSRVRLLLISALLTQAFARLQVMSPESLRDRFKDGTILASYANFGYIPYGQTVMGMIHLDKSNPDACKEFPETEIKRIEGNTPFMIAARGGCSFVQKIRNMENAGVAAGIIVDNKNENITQILMSDDGTGGGIRIPSMLIGKTDGENIIDWLSSVNEEEHAKMNIMMDFVMNVTTENKVAYDFWYTSSSDRSLDFLEDFAQVEKKLGNDNVDFTPHFVFWQCVHCDERYTSKDCYGGGKYCAVEPSNRKINGKEIVMEDLRQKCLWLQLSKKETTDKWWDYVSRVHRTCYNVINQECSKNAFEHLSLDWSDNEACVDSSFDSDDWTVSTTTNKLIDEEIGYWREFGTNIYPSVVINKKTFRGQIEPLSVFNALCAAFKNPPSQCMKTLHKEPLKSMKEALQDVEDAMKNGSNGISRKFVFWIFIVLIVVNIIIVYLCRRKAKIDMNNEMNVQVESAVSQYFALQQNEKSEA